MRYIFAFIFLIVTFNVAAQANPRANNDHFVDSQSTLRHVFLLEAETEQILNLDTVTYHRKKFYVALLNNTKDTVFLPKACCISKPPIMWEVQSPKSFYLPNDSIHIEIDIYNMSREYWSLNWQIQLKYHLGDENNLQKSVIKTKGILIDSTKIKRRLAIKKEKELEALRDDPNYKFYDSGEIKSIRNPNRSHDSIPLRITYYRNGSIRMFEYRGMEIEKEFFDKAGHLVRTWDDQGLRTEYYPNGNVKFKMAKDTYSATEPFQTFYYENGCLEKEVFLNKTIIKMYDSTNCGQLIDQTVINETKNALAMKYGNVITHYKDGKIVGKTYQTYGITKNETEGEYDKEKLVNGTVSYHMWTGEVVFVNKIENGQRDSVLSKGEKQGQQINLVNENGQKTGLWITDKTTKQPIKFSADYTETYYDRKDFDFFQYEYQNGDTIARLTFYDNRGKYGYLYVRDKEKRIKNGLFYFTSYYENGFLKGKGYQLKHGVFVGLKYSETVENKIIGGNRGNTGTLIFKNNQLVEIRSKPIEIDHPDVWDHSSSRSHSNSQAFCVEKGSFKHFELYNGFIYYYKADSTLRLTEKVVNGIIQSNPRVNFKQPHLKNYALRNDLNFNGWVEKREVNQLTTIRLTLSETDLNTFRWHELKYFNNLRVLRVNERIYTLTNYADYNALKAAIIEKKGKPIPRQRYSWEPEIDVEPDVYAQFPGGEDSLRAWIDKNLVYPENFAAINSGTVYVSFLVSENGTISEIKILRGIGQYYDREVKRLISSMPNWIPAAYYNEKMKSTITIPIRFNKKE